MPAPARRVQRRPRFVGGLGGVAYFFGTIPSNAPICLLFKQSIFVLARRAKRARRDRSAENAATAGDLPANAALHTNWHGY
jgi:hypothetical protein